MTETPRRPLAFDVTDPRIRMSAERDEADALNAVVIASPIGLVKRRSRRMPWATLFWSAAGGLVTLALGMAVTNFVEDLFARSEWLGSLGLALASLAGLALLALIGREVAGLMRLSAIESLRERAIKTLVTDDRAEGQAIVGDLLALTQRMPALARGRARLTEHRGDIIDGRDLVRMAERELMPALDEEARRMVSSASKRVSVVTAVSPRAAVDMIFVVINTLSLIRRLAILYGGRPGTLGVLRLLRQTISHLAVTGGMAVSDSLMQQVVGHGLAARLSAKLGEGVLNGLLTARLGLMAIEQTRPLPFEELPRPALNDLASGLFRSSAPKEPDGSA